MFFFFSNARWGSRPCKKQIVHLYGFFSHPIISDCRFAVFSFFCFFLSSRRLLASSTGTSLRKRKWHPQLSFLDTNRKRKLHHPILFPLFLNLHLLSQLGVTRQPPIRLSNLKSSLSTGGRLFLGFSPMVNCKSIGIAYLLCCVYH